MRQHIPPATKLTGRPTQHTNGNPYSTTLICQNKDALTPKATQHICIHRDNAPGDQMHTTKLPSQIQTQYRQRGSRTQKKPPPVKHRHLLSSDRKEARGNTGGVDNNRWLLRAGKSRRSGARVWPSRGFSRGGRNGWRLQGTVHMREPLQRIVVGLKHAAKTLGRRFCTQQCKSELCVGSYSGLHFFHVSRRFSSSLSSHCAQLASIHEVQMESNREQFRFYSARVHATERGRATSCQKQRYRRYTLKQQTHVRKAACSRV